MKHNLSQETVIDSDDSGSESSRSSPPAKKVSKIEKKKQGKEKSESKSKSKSKQKAPAPESDSSSSESESESKTESESESSSESESERETSKNKESKKSTGKRVTIQESETVIPIPAKAYKPPEGFQFLKKVSSPSNPIPQVFSNLGGKQIWHITAPLGVPVSSIEQLALEAVASGEPILSHKGVKYRLHEDPLGAEKTKSVLLPDKHGNVFRRNQKGVAQTFHIEQVIDLPNGDLSANPEDRNVLKKKAPKQPKNLRMRYKPFGSSNDQPETFGSASEESETEAKSFKVPAGAHLGKASKKRKHTKIDSSVQDDSDIEPSSPESTRKKPKKTSSEVPDSSPHTTKSSKKDTKQRGREEKQQSPEVRKKHREETSTERRARREERKRKKQQK